MADSSQDSCMESEYAKAIQDSVRSVEGRPDIWRILARLAGAEQVRKGHGGMGEGASPSSAKAQEGEGPDPAEAPPVCLLLLPG